MDSYILEVSELNGYVKRLLEADPMLKSVRVRGEISNLSRPGYAGHLYFTLKDGFAQVRCAMFRQDNVRLTMRPADGQRVIASGYISLYPERGEYQFYVKNMRPDGVGSLYEQFEQLKARLKEEGLFDSCRKRQLPLRPRKIAVVTAASGAVIHDVCRVAAARDPGVPILLIPTQVQGSGASREIAAAIRKAGAQPDVDVVIVCRGGGSLEDLWAFNEEAVARAIAACPVPVISGVGHETDTTIADYAADVRASTPSNAAEIAVPTREELLNGLHAAAERLTVEMSHRLTAADRQLLRLRGRLAEQSPEQRLQQAQQQLQVLRKRMQDALAGQTAGVRLRLLRSEASLQHASELMLLRRAEQVRQRKARLTAMNPMNVLERGYALVTAGRHVITAASDAAARDRLDIRFRDGTVRVRTEKELGNGSEEKANL